MADFVRVSTLPPCDFCQEKGVTTKARYDGKTTFGKQGWAGSWANMCPAHWRMYGVGQLGTGYGQELILVAPHPDNDHLTTAPSSTPTAKEQ